MQAAGGQAGAVVPIGSGEHTLGSSDEDGTIIEDVVPRAAVRIVGEVSFYHTSQAFNSKSFSSGNQR